MKMDIAQLDTILLYLKNKHEYTKFKTIQEDNPEIDCDAVIIKLEKDGYINAALDIETRKRWKKDSLTGGIYDVKEEVVGEDKSYRLSFEGFTFLDKPHFPLKNKPYKYTKGIEIIKTIYAVAKTIIAILYALIIISLMYLAIEWKSLMP
ncbi:hypothetical protein WG954_17510 [Lacibacter sp. H375]|uniref:hypothetical protein n=1 Tax=Lacibacter sp. H375 TaxID=3133424 RepID=UPI0030C2F89B